VSGRPAGALAGIAIVFLLFAAPGGAVAGRSGSANALEVPRPAAPMRDVVWGAPGVAAARISATASSQRYAIGDGTGATIEVAVTEACAMNCTAADPQRIADLIGTFVHGPEVGLVTVQLDTPYQLAFECGFGAEACYFTGEDRIVLSGNEEVDEDGADRDFVLAHEYGHHVAQHRDLPAPFPSAVDWGTERWASLEGVCSGRRHGRFFPGDEGYHYFEDPGEAFAEAFAHNRFPEAAVRWRWLPELAPTAESFRAIQEDTLSPWRARTTFVLSGRVPARGEGAAVELLPTPLDGTVTLRPVGLHRRGYELALRSRAGRLLRSFRPRQALREQMHFTVCGQSRLRLEIRSRFPHPTPYRLQIQRP
jgi:hypothetical protein